MIQLSNLDSTFCSIHIFDIQTVSTSYVPSTTTVPLWMKDDYTIPLPVFIDYSTSSIHWRWNRQRQGFPC